MPDPHGKVARNRRRTDTTIGVQQFLDETLFSPLHWPWKTVRLERDSLEDFRQRSLSAGISVSELYHENSKLFLQALPEMAALRVDVNLRKEFVNRRAAEMASEASAISRDPLLTQLLAGVVSRMDLDLFYSIELRLVLASSLVIYEPCAGTFHLIKRLSAQERDALQHAIRLLAPPWLPPHKGGLLFIVGFLGREEMLLGTRGYRRCLLEAGRITQVLLEESCARGQPIHPVFEFADHAVEAAIELDGIEVAALATFELVGADHVG